MPRGKGKRVPQEVKIADVIKKRIGFRSDPSTCENCRYSSEEVPDEFEGFPLACTRFSELVVFGVDEGDCCDSHEKKRKKRGGGRKKKVDEGDVNDVTATEDKPKKKKGKKSKKKDESPEVID